MRLVQILAQNPFFDRMRRWFNKDEQQTPSDEADENVICLSEAFYQEIDQHRIPVEREVIAARAHAPGTFTCGGYGRAGR